MDVQAKQVLDDALTLPDAERRRVGEAILDSVPSQSASEIEAAWLEEALRRASEIERGEAATLDGDQVVAEILAKLGAGRNA